MRITALLTVSVTYEVPDLGTGVTSLAKSDIETTLLALATRSRDDGMLSGDYTGDVITVIPTVTFKD